jgi:uncharacterized membrane protein YheB (UPF0754 family)
MNLNKNILTNIISFLIFIFGIVLDNEYLINIGLFAISGAITNSLAIYMIFEKVPFLYGSGVIEAKFEDFKASIKDLMMKEFFTKQNLEKFLDNEFSKFDFSNIVKNLDYDVIFNSLKQAVMSSQFGGLLNMFGGESALDSLKEPFIQKLQISLVNMANSDSFKLIFEKSISNKDFTNDLNNKIEIIIQNRLDELTPKMVKKMVEDIIRLHLGWLVVWGGVFGGLIGFISTIITT